MTTPQRKQFEEQGFVIVRGLLSVDEANTYRKLIQQLSGVGDADVGKKVFACPDGVSVNEPFWGLIDHPKLLAVIRDILGPDARYTQHSDLHAHRDAAKWHRDNACRHFGRGPDWDESQAPYQIVRVAIYLQTYAESRSSLGVIPRSHRHESEPTAWDKRLWCRWQHLREKLGLAKSYPMSDYPSAPLILTRPRLPLGLPTPPTYPLWVATEPGDTIFFNQRLYHSASKIHGPKYAVYLSYGPDNLHSRNHMLFYRKARSDLGYGPLDPRLAERLKKQGLYLDVDDAPLDERLTAEAQQVQQSY